MASRGILAPQCLPTFQSPRRGGACRRKTFLPLPKRGKWAADDSLGRTGGPTLNFQMKKAFHCVLGMMQSMVTITHNDHVPELLAVIRRKPFAEPTEAEMVEYLFTRVRTDRRKPDFENYAFEHVLSLFKLGQKGGAISIK